MPHPVTQNFWRRVKFYLKKCLQSPPFSFMAINWVKVSKNATSSHPKFLEKGQILPQKMPPVTPILIHGHKLGQSLKKCHIQSPQISGEGSNSTSKNASSHPHDLDNLKNSRLFPISPRDSVEIPWKFREAHSTLAIALNRLGGFSNTGEGGEDPARYGLGVSKSAVQVIPICSSHEID